jgi:hypothetical protein
MADRRSIWDSYCADGLLRCSVQPCVRACVRAGRQAVSYRIRPGQTMASSTSGGGEAGQGMGMGKQDERRDSSDLSFVSCQV